MILPCLPSTNNDARANYREYYRLVVTRMRLYFLYPDSVVVCLQILNLIQRGMTSNRANARTEGKYLIQVHEWTFIHVFAPFASAPYRTTDGTHLVKSTLSVTVGHVRGLWARFQWILRSMMCVVDMSCLNKVKDSLRVVENHSAVRTGKHNPVPCYCN